MGTLIITILTSVGGSAIVIGILQKLVINSLIEMQRHNNLKAIEEIKKTYLESLKDLEFKYLKEIEDYKTTLKNYVRYSDEQFKLYNEFWSSLTDLKHRADDLWRKADTTNLSAFAQQLKETKEKIERSRLIIEEDHYQILKRIFEKFEDFSFGKTSLINLRRNRNEDRHQISPSEINSIIRFNGLIKEQYDDLTKEIFLSLKKQVYFSKLNDRN